MRGAEDLRESFLNTEGAAVLGCAQGAAVKSRARSVPVARPAGSVRSPLL